MVANVDLKAKAMNIKAFVSDVDGVMTDGSITYDENGTEYKTFNAKDGQGLVRLIKSGIVTAIITARENGTVTHRFEKLGVSKIYQGQKQKDVALEQFMQEYNIKADEIVYVGDDLPDICVLEKVAISACPQDAVDEVKEVCNFISSKCGGKGAVREICDFIYTHSKYIKK